MEKSMWLSPRAYITDGPVWQSARVVMANHRKAQAEYERCAARLNALRANPASQP